MEGSYYILLIYTAANTTDRCPNYTAFLKLPTLRNTMAHLLPDHFFYQKPQYSANHHSMQAHPHLLGRDGLFSLDTLGRNKVQNTVSLDQYYIDRTGTLGFHKKIFTYSLKIENPRRSNFSSHVVSHLPIQTNVSGPSVPGSAIYNLEDHQGSISTSGSASNVAASNNVSFHEDTLRQQPMPAIYGDLPKPPEFVPRRKLPIDATTPSGLQAGGSGNPMYLAAESITMNPGNDCYTPRRSQPFFGQPNANSLGPTQGYNPLYHCAPQSFFSDNDPNHLGPRASATCHTPNLEPPKPLGTNFNGLDYPDRYNHSQPSNSHHSAANKSGIHHPKPSDIPNPSHKSARSCSKSNNRDYNAPESFDNLASRQLALKAGKTKQIQRSKQSSTRRLAPRVKIPTDFDPSDTPNHSHLARDMTDSNIFDASGTSFQDPFELFTTHYHPEHDEDECKVADKPIATEGDSSHAPDAESPTNYDPSNSSDHSDLLRDKMNLDTIDLGGSSIQGPFDSFTTQDHPDSNTDEYKVAHKPIAPNVDMSRVPNDKFPTTFESSKLSGDSHLLSNMTSLVSLDFPGTSIQGPLLSTDQYHLDKVMDECKIADEPSLINGETNRVPDTVSLPAGQCSTDHPIGAVEVPRPQKERVERRKYQRSKKAEKETRRCSTKPPRINPEQRDTMVPNARQCSTGLPVGDDALVERSRPQIESVQQEEGTQRPDPKKWHFCSKVCKWSGKYEMSDGTKWRGFRQHADALRHELTHDKEKKHVCTLPHATSENKWFRRRDGLRT